LHIPDADEAFRRSGWASVKSFRLCSGQAKNDNTGARISKIGVEDSGFDGACARGTDLCINRSCQVYWLTTSIGDNEAEFYSVTAVE